MLRRFVLTLTLGFPIAQTRLSYGGLILMSMMTTLWRLGSRPLLTTKRLGQRPNNNWRGYSIQMHFHRAVLNQLGDKGANIDACRGVILCRRLGRARTKSSQRDFPKSLLQRLWTFSIGRSHQKSCVPCQPW